MRKKKLVLFSALETPQLESLLGVWHFTTHNEGEYVIYYLDSPHGLITIEIDLQSGDGQMFTPEQVELSDDPQITYPFILQLIQQHGELNSRCNGLYCLKGMIKS